jgi:hypothetical protein
LSGKRKASAAPFASSTVRSAFPTQNSDKWL